jgi:uncharacterized protein involved in exopolysaccharide biosynthesis/Mrp family chromosome partitioning ATPase
MVFGSQSKEPEAPAAAAYHADGEPDMRGLGRLLWRRRSTILGVTLIFAAAAFVIVNLITPLFLSESRLLLESRENVFLRADADKNTDRSAMDAEAVTSQTQVVLSRDLAREVIVKEKLGDKSEFNPTSSVLRTILGLFGLARDPGTMTREERTLEAYYERLNVFAIEKSRVIVVDFSSADPQLASNVANSIAETYIRTQQVQKQEQTRAAAVWLAGEIDKMRVKVADAEAKVEAYRTKSNLYSGSNNSSLSSQQLTEINSQISAARGQQADLEARATQLRALIKSGQPIVSSDIANSESIRRLSEQRMILRAQLAEQSTTLLDKHPRIKELRAQIAELDQLTRSEAERLARQLDNDSKVAGDRIKTLTASLDQAKRAASQTNEQDVELRSLEREAKTQRDLLDSYLAKYREATARETINSAPPESRVISRATPAIKPTYPKKLPMVLIAAFAGFALSAGFIVAGAILAIPGAGHAEASEPAEAAPVEPAPTRYVAPIASVPIEHAPPVEPTPGHHAAHSDYSTPLDYAPPADIAPPDEPPAVRTEHATYADYEAPARHTHHDEVAPPAESEWVSPGLVPPAMEAAHAPLGESADSSVAEGPATTIEQIARDLQIAGIAGRRITVLGAERNVGTTFAAITLARALAESANVVLVDLAFAAPNLSVISTDPAAPGVAELVQGKASFGAIITRDQFSKLHLVTTGQLGDDVAKLASSPMVATIIEALVRSYDHVVLDVGAAPEVDLKRFAQLAPRAVLVTADPANAATRSAREHMIAAGYGEISLLIGGSRAVAA